jgi:hypothetical protein
MSSSRCVGVALLAFLLLASSAGCNLPHSRSSTPLSRPEQGTVEVTPLSPYETGGPLAKGTLSLTQQYNWSLQYFAISGEIPFEVAPDKYVTGTGQGSLTLSTTGYSIGGESATCTATIPMAFEVTGQFDLADPQCKMVLELQESAYLENVPWTCSVPGVVPLPMQEDNLSLTFTDIFFTREQPSYELEAVADNQFVIKVINFAIADKYWSCQYTVPLPPP